MIRSLLALLPRVRVAYEYHRLDFSSRMQLRSRRRDSVAPDNDTYHEANVVLMINESNNHGLLLRQLSSMHVFLLVIL